MAGSTPDMLKYALKNGVQVSPDVVGLLEQIDSSELDSIIRDIVREKKNKRETHITRRDIERILGLEDEGENFFEVLSDPTGRTTSASGAEGYGMLFVNRFEKMKKIMVDQKIGSIRTIRSISTDNRPEEDPDGFLVCGLVGHITVGDSPKISIEDLTGNATFPVFDEKLKGVLGLLFHDQFVTLRVATNKRGARYVKEIIQPGFQLHKPNKSKLDVWVALLSDLHVGSKYFLRDEFEGFLDWLAGNDPVARRVGFVIIAGDVVDGVGIYKNQNEELLYQTVETQLEVLWQYLQKIPDSVEVFISVGNHDPGRRALPQPAIPKKYNQKLWERKNIHMLGNPAEVSLNGVRVLMFHGQSIDDMVKSSPGLSYSDPVTVMEGLVRVRHLSPIYGERTPIAPESEDMMVIENVPDVIHSGHVHVNGISTYRGVLLVNSGAWQKQTPFQKSVGVVPTPGIAVLLNLKTFNIKTWQV